jgi:prevent-host-death family protein
MSVTQARARLADTVDQARTSHAPVYLTRRGRPVAAIIDSTQLDVLVAAAEDLEDMLAVEAAKAELAGGAQPVAWEEVRRDLGLD